MRLPRHPHRTHINNSGGGFLVNAPNKRFICKKIFKLITKKKIVFLKNIFWKNPLKNAFIYKVFKKALHVTIVTCNTKYIEKKSNVSMLGIWIPKFDKESDNIRYP